jgi:hypothetical protein
LIKVL